MTNFRKVSGLAAVALALGAGPVASLAQSAPPATATTGLPTHEQLENGAPPVRPQSAPPSHLHVDDKVERAPCALDGDRFSTIRVRITQATFANLGPVAASVVEPAWKPYAGTDQPISVLCRIRDQAATTLRALGYLAAVEVPVQRITDGQVRFEVLYARVVSVRVIGHPGHNQGVLQSYLNRLVDGQVFNRFRAEREVLLARDIPGYELYLTLKPSGTGAGAMIAEVRVENTPVVVDATVSDLAAPSTGRIGAQVRATFNGLTGMGDQTTLSVYSTSQVHKQQILQLGHQLQLGSSEVQIASHLTYAITRPEIGGGLPPFQARTWLFNLGASYPVMRHEDYDVRVSTGLDVVNQNVTFDYLAFSRDRLRVGYVRLDADAHDPRGAQAWGLPLWRLSASLELRHGLSILGATPNCLTYSPCLTSTFVRPSVSIGNPEATVMRASADVEINPARVISLEFALRGQATKSPLYAFEQFSLGNYSTGRGYAPGSLVGDSGISLSSDLRGPVVRLADRAAIGAQPFVFADNGWAWRRLIASPSPDSLHSVGGGVRFVFGSLAQLDASVAVPLTRLATETRTEPPLFLLTLSTRLWPWRYR